MKKPSRNDPCSCGSGKKYKQCCQARDEVKTVRPRPPDSSTSQALKAALEHLQAGRLPQAEAHYQQVLQAEPEHPDALSWLGVIAHQVGKHEIAVELISKAIGINPSGSMYFNLGNALQAQGKLDQAVAGYQKALALKLDFAEVHYNLGLALQTQGRLEGAIASYQQALFLNPAYVKAHFNLAIAFQAQGNLDAAAGSYRKTISLNPGLAEAHYNLGVVLQTQGRLEEAVTSYQAAISLNPAYAKAHYNLGLVLQQQCKLEAAIDSYRKALLSRPDYAEAHNNLGLALYEQDRLDEAVASYLNALSCNPAYADAHSNLGLALQKQGKLDAAVESYRKALELNPDFIDARSNLFSAQLRCCDWEHYAGNAEKITSAVNEHRQGVDPFSFLAISNSAAAQLMCARIHGARKYPPSKMPLWTGRRYDHGKIRVAYLSADFRNHAVANLIAELFEVHDKERFEITAISFGADDEKGDMRARLRRSFDQFMDVRDQGDREVAMLMQKMEIDIAVDLNGYTKNNRTGILSHRAVPIQVNYLGYTGSMGAEYIDYIIADACVIPPEHHACYSEKVVCLPDSFQVNDSKRSIAQRMPTRAEVELPETGFVFCCFNNNYKITPEIFAVWMRLLNQVEGSVLWLLEDNAAAAVNLRREAVKRGIAPERLVFAPRMNLDEHLARHRLADLCLDTLPFNAHTTTSDALWTGLPVLTCIGSTFAGRVAASLLNAIGLPDLITHTLDEYEALALRYATTPAMQAETRARLARNRTAYPLFDTGRICHHIEAAYVTMWERYQRGEPPTSFAVQPLPWII